MLLAAVMVPSVIDSVSLEALQRLWLMKWDLVRLPLKSLKELQKSFCTASVALAISTNVIEAFVNSLCADVDASHVNLDQLRGGGTPFSNFS